jgi:aerobic-type carbon monoxide dehydrogenase small subunit (CoxS/CutS family)
MKQVPKKSISLNVNGTTYSIDVKPYDSLNRVLREEIGLTGTKRGCDTGGCGSCTVIIDGKAMYSCMYPVLKAEGKKVLTIEGLSERGEHPLQSVSVKNAAFQCAYCGPGIIMSAKALLDRNQNPSETDVREALVGNICRCTGYGKIVDSILEAAGQLHMASTPNQ